jgi:hypothetical protein
MRHAHSSLVSVSMMFAFICTACASSQESSRLAALLDAPCDPGYEDSMIAEPADHQYAPELQPLAHARMCVANPEVCHTDAECSKNYECNFHTQTYVPAGAGVCWPRVDAAALSR